MENQELIDVLIDQGLIKDDHDLELANAIIIMYEGLLMTIQIREQLKAHRQLLTFCEN